MKTGYFAKLKKYEEAGLTPVSICGKAPEWYEGWQYKKLAPRWAFFNEWKNGTHKGDNEYYISHFNSDVLNGLDPNRVVKEIEVLAQVPADKIILICYEKPDDFCHRHLVAEWLEKSGIDCKELLI